PPYRLPAEVVDEEIAILKDIGIEICTNVDVVSVKTVKDAFDAVLVAAGALRGITPFGPGEEPDNVFSALDFLKRACAGVLPEPGGMVTVVGGGNVAFDCARTSAKAGAGAVRVLCLEGRDKMLADEEEVEAALGEGVMIMNGMLATGAHAEGSLVSEVSAIAVKSFSFGLSGLEYEAEAGSEAVFLTDTLIYAMGQRVGLPEGFGLERGRGGAVVTGENCMTEMEGVFAAGDVVTGTKSLVEAVASGTCAASGIDLFLGGDGDVGLTLFDRDAPVADIGVIEGFSKIPRCEGVVDEADARREASRCLQCDLRLSIPRVKYWGDEVYRAGMRQEGREPGGDAEESLAGLPGKTSGKAGAGGKTAGGKAGGKEGAGGKTAAEEDAIRLCGKVYGDLCQPDYRDGADCPVDWSLGLMEKLARGSCGRDTLCRDGGRETANILADIAGGRGVDGDMELLGELLSAMRTGANCDMGREAAGQVLCLLDGHEDKWRQHISRKRCPDLACKALVSLHIDPEKCTGCGSCMGACEAGAIAGGAGLIHVIDRQACTKCMKCSGACPEDAVVKTTTGAIVRVPEAPVPAGGFAGSGEGRRRRRKGI
ncbi:MAG: FAD-dependent oxidoreductase, partial [Clostridiales bacterium]|nr:FAD-dependent oxidoreductase [Clostridiales bacterium]